jgi:hypothetical protein
VIDHGRLQKEAWKEVLAARRLLDRAAKLLQHHESVDAPAYQQWLYATFPELLTELRALQEAVLATARKIQAVQRHAFQYGGSAKHIWREQRAQGAPSRTRGESREDRTDDRFRDAEIDLESFRSTREPSLDARAIYRRLVQRLHPDRGGDWTVDRERLWHEVQRAWAAGDADWLARLEADWETANDVLGPQSAVSRLRQAVKELAAARRDIHRKLGEYRADPSWRFTKTAKARPTLFRSVQRRLRHDLAALQDQLAHLNRVIASWEEDWTKPARRGGPRRER